MELASLQGAEQAPLGHQVHVADVLEQQGAAIGLFQQTGLRYAARLPTEQLDVRVFRLQGSDAHIDKGSLTVLAAGVQVAGEDPLAAAGLSLY